MKKLFLSLGILISGTLVGLVFQSNINVIQASISGYTAAEFAQYCEANPSTCTKTNFSNTKVGSVSCPSPSQVIDVVYVHAGDGQTVYQLPDPGFTTVFSNNNNTVEVTANPHPHDLSWISVTCVPGISPTPTSTPTPTPINTPTNTPTPTPTVPDDRLTPTPTPTEGQQPSPTPTPTPTDSEEQPTPTPTPTASPTATPTITLTPGPGRVAALEYQVSCDKDEVKVEMRFTNDGKAMENVTAEFDYNGKKKTATSNSDGWAIAIYPKDGENKVTGYADGFYKIEKTVEFPDCPATTGTVLGATTSKGQVLGATSYAKTGLAEDALMQLSGVLGTLMISVGALLHAKQK